MTAAQTLIWETAGRPPVDGAKGKLLKDIPGICDITGELFDVTADAKKALGENFTDHSLWAAHGGRVGPAALWCCSGKGAASPRMWSWICAPGETLPPSHEKAAYSAPGLCCTNRANTRPIIDTLTNPPAGEWVLCIAVSSQKHVLPYARTNHGRESWTIRMEDTTITSTPQEFQHVLGHVLVLRRLGIPADAIKAGEPGPFLKTMEHLRTWKHHAAQLAPFSSSPITDLALWCATKPILEDTNAYPNA